MSASDPTGVPAVRWLRWIAFGAAAALTASGEFELAGLAGWPWWVAWLLPVALDVYAFASFSTHRRMDTLAALGLMISCNAAYHLAATGIIPVGWQLVVLVAALPPVICWRVHRLGEAHAPRSAADAPNVPPAEVPVPDAPAEPLAAPVVPPVRKLAAVPAERKQRQEVTVSVRKRMPLAERRKQAEALRAEHPDWTQRKLAEQLEISDRQLRNALAAV